MAELGSTNIYGRLTINEDLIVNVGNVGIGTTDPGDNVEIYNGTDCFLKLNNGNHWRMGMDNGSSRFDFKYNDVDVLTLAGYETWLGLGGNVGIGTTDPDAKLHVDDGDTTYGLNTKVSAFFGDSVGGSKAGAIKFAGTSAGGYGLIQASTLNLHLDAKSGVYFNWYDGDFVRMKEDLYVDGSVGIGTADPSATLHVVGDIIADNRIGIDTSTLIDKFTINDIADCFMRFTGGVNYWRMGHIGADKFYIFYGNSPHAEFDGPQGQTYFPGGVGIGHHSVDPMNMLDVNGEVIAMGYNTRSNVPIMDGTSALSQLDNIHKWRDKDGKVVHKEHYAHKVIKEVVEEENGEKREKETYSLSLEKRVAELEKMVYELHQMIKSK